ncbi:MAG: tetratricopeptide repeat protein [Anaerolineae bacterium]|nr:tetratricopeptide repeat protein [Anaerolineae bacterium]
MKCATCGERLKLGQQVCHHCGATQSHQPGAVKCRACGTQVGAHLWVCPRCGHDLAGGAAAAGRAFTLSVPTMTMLSIGALLIAALGGALSAGAGEQPSVFMFIAARPTNTPTAIPSPTATQTPTATPSATPSPTPTSTPTASPSPTPPVRRPPTTGVVLINSLPYVSQYLNNCGPASISMVLAHFGITQSQTQIAQVLRPSPQDINVRLDELAAYLRAQGLSTRLVMEGTPERLILLASNKIPAIVEIWIEYQGGMGHFRVLRGFDADEQKLIMHDPLGGPDLRLSHEMLEAGWQAFNRHYLIVYRPEQEPIVAAILGEDYDEETMYRRALDVALARVDDQPGNAFAWLNLGDDYAALHQYEKARQAYEQAMAIGLPDHLLWYHYEPLEVYNALGDYQRTIELTTAIIHQTNGLEEMYYLRGRAYQGLGELDQATADYQAALARNPNYTAAQEALQELSD